MALDAPPAGDRQADRRRARDDEGRGDEARPGDVLPRRRPRARGVPRGVPARAGQAARRGADGLLQADAQGDRGRSSKSRCQGGLRRRSTRSRSPPPRSARSTARRCHDGREVAVKVQYPGVAAAVRADMQNLGMIMRLLKRMAPGLDAKAIAEEIRERIERGARLRARGAEPALARPDLPRPPVHRRPRGRSARCPASGCWSPSSSPASASRSSSSAPRPSATGSARSSSASSSAACTATASSPATPIPATSCCSTTVAWRSWTSGCSSGWTPAAVELELGPPAAVVEGDGDGLSRAARRGGFLPEPERVDPTGAARLHPRPRSGGTPTDGEVAAHARRSRPRC